MENFNEGNDCNTCIYQYFTGRDGDIEACDRMAFDLSCKYEEYDPDLFTE